MKYVIIMQICSALSGTCQEAYKPTIEFESFYDCGIAGYSLASSSIKKINPQIVEKDKLYIRFGCVEKTLEKKDA